MSHSFHRRADSVSYQPSFRVFDQEIQLADCEENADLRERRDAVLEKLRRRIGCAFTAFNQGSYAMGTGIRPASGDIDIDLDVGVVFEVGTSRPTAREIKGEVYSALSDPASEVEWKTPCVTVRHVQEGRPRFHLDLAVYAKNSQGKMFLAWGRQTAEPRWWEADPLRLGEILRRRWAGEDRAQQLRLIRYLKRWRDLHLPLEGRGAPIGIGLTLLAHEHFRPHYEDDLRALRRLLGALPRSGRLVARMPVAPHDDVFARMSDEEMRPVQQRLEQLREWLESAARTGNPVPLRRAFGYTFPA